ncbi:methyltransferase domain-containing protein [candidate division WOR-3 bacterium]|uniref:Methyltransferase domain-containing protein n=1 Tax=candidate division WOR-3 bacterium TaxID=2052148 RepID=A0A937XGN7_UNCW3|nr:methyltransferase domain-containing protein [candidate division WOR-3 bacterium]
MDIRSVTPTLCRLLGIDPPAACKAPPIESVLDAWSLRLEAAPLDRVLIYGADAIGRVFLDNHLDLKKRLVAASDVQVELRAMIPPKTPVCFASVFTGAPPEVHGIRKYERPVITCDTLFDALARAGKRTAIVAVKDCSMDIIFRNRAIDYYTEADDAAVLDRSLQLLKDDRYDFIVSYNQGYDDELHRTSPDSPEAVAAATRHVETFMRLWQATEEHWATYSRALVLVSDHGSHFDAAKGRGDHCDDIPEDMDVLHFWRLRQAAHPDGSERARQAWDEAAETWEDFVESGKDWYRHGLHGPALMRACGEVKGLRVLDLGCGQGYFTRQLARAGAEACAVDISKQQIANALKHEQAESQGIEYRVSDAAAVAELWPAGSFDLVVACMSLHDMPDPGAALQAARRALKDGGRCVFSASHPVMDAPLRGWERDSAGRKVMYRLGRYFDAGPTVCHWTMSRLNRYWTTPIVRLTIEGWSEAIEQAGFLIRRIYEPRPTLEDVAHAPQLDDCRDFPSFLVFDLVTSKA